MKIPLLNAATFQRRLYGSGRGGGVSSAIKRLQIFTILLSYIYASLSVRAKCTYLKALLPVKETDFP